MGDERRRYVTFSIPEDQYQRHAAMCERLGISKRRGWAFIIDAGLSESELAAFVKKIGEDHSVELEAEPHVRLLFNSGSPEAKEAAREEYERLRDELAGLTPDEYVKRVRDLADGHDRQRAAEIRKLRKLAN